VREHAAPRRRRAWRRRRRGRPRSIDLEHHLGDAELHERRRRGRDRPLPLRHGLEGLAPPEQARQLLAVDAPELLALGHAGHGLQPPLEPDDRGADVAALVREHGHAHAPAAVQRAEQGVGGHRDVGEEHLVELRLAGHLPQRPVSMPGRSMSHRKNEMPLCLDAAGSVRAMRMPQSLSSGRPSTTPSGR
jgi:hypothetical protein